MNDNFRNTFKIVFRKKKKITYHVDEDKKTVKCFLTFTLLTPEAQFSNQIMCKKRITVNGYAKCDGKDAYDIETGKKIALARAEENAYLKCLRMIKQARKDAQMFINAANQFEQKAYSVCAHDEEYIDKFFFPNKEDNSTKVDVTQQPRDKQGRFAPKNDKRGRINIPINRK